MVFADVCIYKCTWDVYCLSVLADGDAFSMNCLVNRFICMRLHVVVLIERLCSCQIHWLFRYYSCDSSLVPVYPSLSLSLSRSLLKNHLYRYAISLSNEALSTSNLWYDINYIIYDVYVNASHTLSRIWSHMCEYKCFAIAINELLSLSCMLSFISHSLPSLQFVGNISENLTTEFNLGINFPTKYTHEHEPIEIHH